MFSRGFSWMQTREKGSGKWLEICFKSTFLTQAKTQMQICPYCSLRRSVRFLVFGQLPCWSQFHLGKNEIQFFLLFSLYKMAGCFHWKLSKIQNSFREGTSHSYSLAQYLSITNVYHNMFGCMIPSFLCDYTSLKVQLNS